jgi:hypothetical protein
METSVFERQVLAQLKTLNKTIFEMKEDIAIVKNKYPRSKLRGIYDVNLISFICA